MARRYNVPLAGKAFGIDMPTITDESGTREVLGEYLPELQYSVAPKGSRGGRLGRQRAMISEQVTMREKLPTPAAPVVNVTVPTQAPINFPAPDFSGINAQLKEISEKGAAEFGRLSELINKFAQPAPTPPAPPAPQAPVVTPPAETKQPEPSAPAEKAPEKPAETPKPPEAPKTPEPKVVNLAAYQVRSPYATFVNPGISKETKGALAVYMQEQAQNLNTQEGRSMASLVKNNPSIQKTAIEFLNQNLGGVQLQSTVPLPATKTSIPPALQKKASEPVQPAWIPQPTVPTAPPVTYAQAAKPTTTPAISFTTSTSKAPVMGPIAPAPKPTPAPTPKPIAATRPTYTPPPAPKPAQGFLGLGARR